MNSGKGSFYISASAPAIAVPVDAANVDVDAAPAYAVPVPPDAVYHQSTKKDLDEKQLQAVIQLRFTRGMAESLSHNLGNFPRRYWIVDNSGSMYTQDGHCLVDMGPNSPPKSINCTRWEELRESVVYHASLSAILEAPTYFRLLNEIYGKGRRSQFFNVAVKGSAHTGEDLITAKNIINSVRPSGVTPLTEHIVNIRREIIGMARSLRDQGQRAVVVIATDGSPSDENGYTSSLVKSQFLDALRSLEGLPVWIVIRLCTDEDDVVDFYNNIDEELELSIDVLDDFTAEAEEVCHFNPWINYALVIHRMRELGFYDRTFDMIDERTINKSELRDYCKVLFGAGKMDGIPDPNIHWEDFSTRIMELAIKEGNFWNPLKKKMMPLIDKRALDRTYSGNNECCSIM